MTVDSEQHAIAKWRYLLNEIVQYENLKEYLKFAITVTLVPDIKNYMKIVVFLIFDVLLIHMYVYKADSVLRFTWLYSNPYLTITYSILHIKEFSQYQHQIANKCTATKKSYSFTDILCIAAASAYRIALSPYRASWKINCVIILNMCYCMYNNSTLKHPLHVSLVRLVV